MVKQLLLLDLHSISAIKVEEQNNTVKILFVK